jgi:hypothetical protein
MVCVEDTEGLPEPLLWGDTVPVKEGEAVAEEEPD